MTGIAALAMGAGWAALTLWAESAGPKRSWKLGNQAAKKRALIVYDADPFYNLDEQVCRSFGQALADNGMRVTVATVRAARESPEQSADLYVFCANTYNWAPDWSVRNFIEQHVKLNGKPVVAITVGSGGTGSAQKALEKLILAQKATLLGSRSLWLMKPNDEARAKESNVAVAVSAAYAWGEKIALQVNAR
ncbi:hypothetical protein [Hymenobacter sp.]|uniref:flavodoxin family protein n=1 Tax=Hymenobacter sp. TaxID=1898978 RepID=UPI00286CE50E|nr:hypothetical protein [Hymenobacter sp.]